LGVPAEGSLGEDELTVEGHFEAALGRRDQLDPLDDRRPPGEELVRQTDGTGNVVSGDAELDQHVMAGVKHAEIVTGTEASTPRFL
jgi:hypothetical protein